MYKIISLFSGAGGLDLGFEKAGFNIVFANEFDKTIWETYKKNFPNTMLNTEDIRNLDLDILPKDIDGIIGGPPCQSFSIAGKGLGKDDPRGKLFYNYLKVIEKISPKFFLLENVTGILLERHKEYLDSIINKFKILGYKVNVYKLNAADYEVPQDRNRVFILGTKENILINDNIFFPVKNKISLKDSILDLKDSGVIYNKLNKLEIPNHEYMMGSFSTIYMSRNRVRAWDEQSFTIQASGRHIPIHPSVPKMQFFEKDKFIFAKGFENLYRRLTVRECARIQTFPDSFIFYYNRIEDGYKMVGNAVPVNLSFNIAKAIKKFLSNSSLLSLNLSKVKQSNLFI